MGNPTKKECFPFFPHIVGCPRVQDGGKQLKVSRRSNVLSMTAIVND